MTDEEMLKLLERAQSLFEMGIPGLVVGAGMTMLAGFSQDYTMALIGIGITAASCALIELGRRSRDKVPDHEL